MYEITLIVKEEADADSVNELLKTFSGKMISEKKWGKRILAYPINKITSAYYLTKIVEIPDTKLAEFRSKMQYNEKLIRFLLLKVEQNSLKNASEAEQSLAS